VPELPEVETICRGLAPVLEGRRIVQCLLRRKDLRFPFPRGFAQKIQGARITRIERRAKYILLHLDNGSTVLLHLGMSGRLHRVDAARPFAKHDHVILTTDQGNEVRFNDSRRFGILDIMPTAQADAHKLLRHLGPEPLSEALTPKFLAAALADKKTPIKAALLDQTVIAGLGNIYVSESLFYAGVHPERLAKTLTLAEIKRLVPAIRRVLNAAIASGGSSLRDYVQADGSLGYFQHHFAVYDRAGQPCPGCACALARTGGIQRIVQSGRATYYCQRKQK